MIKRRDIICALILIVAFPSFAQTAGQDELPDDYLPFTLHLTGDTLAGRCQFLEGFRLSMDLPGLGPGGIPGVDSLFSLVRTHHVTGTLTYPSGRTTAIEYEIVHHRAAEDIYMKSSLGYFLWEYLSVQNDTLRFAIYWWYCPPASKRDLQILEMAGKLLADSSRWHQKDDRKCEDDLDNGTWSLFCALKHASLEKAGEYNHHNTAIQTARFVIDDLLPDHGFAHTLMDFNNSPTTSHQEILHVLELAKRRIKRELTKSSTPQQEP